MFNQEGIQVQEGIITSLGIYVDDGSRFAAGQSVAPHEIYGHCVVPWGGSNKTISIASANVYQRVSETSILVGNNFNGLVHNNDGSFTNNTGGTVDVMGLLVAQSYSTTNYVAFSAGSDNGGSDAVVAGTTGSTKLSTDVGDGPISHYHWYHLSLDAGKSVFPMVKKNTGTVDAQLSSLKHIIRS